MTYIEKLYDAWCKGVIDYAEYIVRDYQYNQQLRAIRERKEQEEFVKDLEERL